MKHKTVNLLTIFASILLFACEKEAQQARVQHGQIETTLQEAAPFPVGTATSSYQIRNDSVYREVLIREFSSVTAENEMKMAWLQPEEGKYTWENADFIVDWALENGKQVHGHTLIWHQATPDWVEKYDGDSAKLEQIMKDHITNVVNHFKGRVKSWDVINETIENNTGEWRKTIWYNNLGEDYLARAHQYAREADPEVKLFFNEYSLETDTAKLEGAFRVIDDFILRGVPLDGVGYQFHTQIGKPPLQRFIELAEMVTERGLLLHISELDISVNGTASTGTGITTFEEDLAEAQRVRYRNLAQIYQVVPASQRYAITTWGFTDKYTWIRGYFKKIDWPLLFDENFNKKPAYHGYLEGLKSINIKMQ